MRFYALNPDGSLKWRTDEIGAPFDMYGWYSVPAIDIDGKIYVTSTDGSDNILYAINTNGEIVGECAPHEPSGIDSGMSPAIGPDGTIYFAATARILCAVNSEGLTLKWKFDTEDTFAMTGYGVVAIGLDGTIYLCADKDLIAIDSEDGTEKWRFDAGWGLIRTPAVGSDGVIYVLAQHIFSSRLYAINPDNTLKWRVDLGFRGGGPAIGLDDTIYITAGDYLYAFCPIDGSKIWEYRLKGTSMFSSPAIGSDGTIYVGSSWEYHHGALYAVDSGGNLKWEYEANDSVSSSPAIGADGTVYVGSVDGRLYAIGGPPAPTPDIKANASDGPITLNQSDTLTVTVASDNNGITDNADWWLCAETPFGLYFYTFYGWVPYTQPVHQGALVYLDTLEVFSIGCSGLEEGTYTLYFGIDTNMDGNITWDSLYSDTVEVNVLSDGQDKPDLIVSGHGGITIPGGQIWDPFFQIYYYIDYVTVWFTVKNVGEGDASGFYIDVYIDGEKRETIYTDGLGKGESEEFSERTFTTLNIGGHTFHSYTIHVDSTNVIDESDENNNIASGVAF